MRLDHQLPADLPEIERDFRIARGRGDPGRNPVERGCDGGAIRPAIAQILGDTRRELGRDRSEIAPGRNR